MVHQYLSDIIVMSGATGETCLKGVTRASVTPEKWIPKKKCKNPNYLYTKKGSNSKSG